MDQRWPLNTGLTQFIEKLHTGHFYLWFYFFFNLIYKTKKYTLTKKNEKNNNKIKNTLKKNDGKLDQPHVYKLNRKF